MKMTVIVFLCVSLSVGDNGYHGGVYRLSLISQTFCFRPFTHHVSGYGCMGGKRWTQQTKTQNPALMLIVHRNNKKDQNLCRAETRKNKNKGQVETRTINTQGNEARGKPVGNETKEVKLNTGHMSRETTKIKQQITIHPDKIGYTI